jgi:hypothetical protein
MFERDDGAFELLEEGVELRLDGDHGRGTWFCARYSQFCERSLCAAATWS